MEGALNLKEYASLILIHLMLEISTAGSALHTHTFGSVPQGDANAIRTIDLRGSIYRFA
jgi:hypothetical protein